jgi:hypothetical protein
MEQQKIIAICNQVYQKFPEVRGAQPSVASHGENQILLIFKGRAQAADGKTINRIVRVVASTDGKISKMTTSR